MIFLKHFDTSKQSIFGVGRVYMAQASKVGDLVPVINERMRWTDSTPLRLYEVSHPRNNLTFGRGLTANRKSNQAWLSSWRPNFHLVKVRFKMAMSSVSRSTFQRRSESILVFSIVLLIPVAFTTLKVMTYSQILFNTMTTCWTGSWLSSSPSSKIPTANSALY